MAKKPETLTPPKRPPSPKRVAAFEAGISAESRAASYLVSRGFRILARRFRTKVGEIDIIARNRMLLVFVEVKARGSRDAAAESITPRNRQRIVAAAEAWLAENPGMADCDMRFDAILVPPSGTAEHIPGAFDAS